MKKKMAARLKRRVLGQVKQKIKSTKNLTRLHNYNTAYCYITYHQLYVRFVMYYTFFLNYFFYAVTLRIHTLRGSQFMYSSKKCGDKMMQQKYRYCLCFGE